MERKDFKFNDYLEKLSSCNSAPGGGSTAGISGAIATSLTMMVLNILNSKDFFSEDFFRKKINLLQEMKESFLDLAKEDSKAYENFRKGKSLNSEQSQSKLKKAINIPLQICSNADDLNEIIEGIIPYVKSNLIGDVDAALRFNENAFRISFYNIKVNRKDVKDKEFIFKINDFCTIESAGIMEQFKKLMSMTEEKLKG